MSVTIGTKLGSSEITTLLGKGGMGEVYRVHDKKLNREVAIKVLPDEFAKDPERIARFHREAQAVAALNHPNIAAIHELAQSGATRFLTRLSFEGRNAALHWTPDGKRGLYNSARAGANSIFWKLADGSGPEELLITSTNPRPGSVTPDGRSLLLQTLVPKPAAISGCFL